MFMLFYKSSCINKKSFSCLKCTSASSNILSKAGLPLSYSSIIKSSPSIIPASLSSSTISYNSSDSNTNLDPKNSKIIFISSSSSSSSPSVPSFPPISAIISQIESTIIEWGKLLENGEIIINLSNKMKKLTESSLLLFKGNETEKVLLNKYIEISFMNIFYRQLYILQYQTILKFVQHLLQANNSKNSKQKTSKNFSSPTTNTPLSNSSNTFNSNKEIISEIDNSLENISTSTISLSSLKEFIKLIEGDYMRNVTSSLPPHLFLLERNILLSSSNTKQNSTTNSSFATSSYSLLQKFSSIKQLHTILLLILTQFHQNLNSVKIFQQELSALLQALSTQQRHTQILQQQLQSLSTTSHTPFNFGFAYRPPDTHINISGAHQNGRNSIQIACLPDESAPLLGPNGFVHGVSPGNLGLSFNFQI